MGPGAHRPQSICATIDLHICGSWSTALISSLPEINITLLEQMGGGRMGSMKTRRDNGAGSAAEWPEVIKLRNFHTVCSFYFILPPYVWTGGGWKKFKSSGTLGDWILQVQRLRPKMHKSNRPHNPDPQKVAAISYRRFAVFVAVSTEHN